jgi:hypothetical protein
MLKLQDLSVKDRIVVGNYQREGLQLEAYLEVSDRQAYGACLALIGLLGEAGID